MTGSQATAVVEFWNQAIARPCLLPRTAESRISLRNAEIDYLECLQDENGNYRNKCFCGATFQGPKRAMTCKNCTRNQIRHDLQLRLRDIFCGLTQGGEAYGGPVRLDELNADTRNGYYHAVFTAFGDSLRANNVPFLAFDQTVAKNLSDLASLLTDLGVSSFHPLLAD